MSTTRGVVTKLYEAYNAHQPADIAALYAPACTHRDIAAGAHHVTPESIATGIAALFDALPDAQWTTESVLTEGDRAAVTYELTGHLHGRLGLYPPNGQSLRLSGVQLVEIKDGQIVSSSDYWDGGALHRQLSC